MSDQKVEERVLTNYLQLQCRVATLDVDFLCMVSNSCYN